MKLLLYCTKAKPYLIHESGCYDSDDMCCDYDCFSVVDRQELYNQDIPLDETYNGKIVAECDYDVEEIYQVYGRNHPIFDENGLFDDYIDYVTNNLNEKELLKQSCLNLEEIEKYNPKYAIHIKNLHIFDEPRDLRDYSKNENPYNYIENAPQNMMYAYDVKSFNNFEKKVLISIQPQWMCLILNHIKDVEIRRVVLKEMLNNE